MPSDRTGAIKRVRKVVPPPFVEFPEADRWDIKGVAIGDLRALLAALDAAEAERDRAERFIAWSCDPLAYAQTEADWISALHRKHFPQNYATPTEPPQ
jgi:hypothetical protein